MDKMEMRNIAIALFIAVALCGTICFVGEGFIIGRVIKEVRAPLVRDTPLIETVPPETRISTTKTISEKEIQIFSETYTCDTFECLKNNVLTPNTKVILSANIQGGEILDISDNVVVDCFGYRIDTENEFHIKILNKINITFNGCRFEMPGSSLEIADSSNIIFSDNAITQSSYYDGWSDYGLYFSNISNLEVENNLISGVISGGYAIGIHADHLSQNVSIKNNTIFDLQGGENFGSGGIVSEADESKIYQNKLIGISYGISLYGQNSEIYDNEFSENLYGFYLYDSSGNTFSNNTISESVFADFLSEGSSSENIVFDLKTDDSIISFESKDISLLSLDKNVYELGYKTIPRNETTEGDKTYISRQGATSGGYIYKIEVYTPGLNDSAQIRFKTWYADGFMTTMRSQTELYELNIEGGLNTFYLDEPMWIQEGDFLSFYTTEHGVLYMESYPLPTHGEEPEEPEETGHSYTVLNGDATGSGMMVITVLKFAFSINAHYSQIPSDPAGYSNISHYFNITGNSLDSWVYLNTSFTQEDILRVIPESISIQKYNGTEWLKTGFEEINNVNIDDRYVYTNITNFGSIFAPMGELPEITECKDIIYPGDYVLTQNLTGVLDGENYCIGIFADDVTLDCDGYTLEGSGEHRGIFVQDKNEATITGCNIINYDVGVYIKNHNFLKFINNSISGSTSQDFIVEDDFYNNTITNLQTGNVVSSFEARDISLRALKKPIESCGHEPIERSSAIGGNKTYFIRGDQEFSYNGYLYKVELYSPVLEGEPQIKFKVWYEFLSNWEQRTESDFYELNNEGGFQTIYLNPPLEVQPGDRFGFYLNEDGFLNGNASLSDSYTPLNGDVDSASGLITSVLSSISIMSYTREMPPPDIPGYISIDKYLLITNNTEDSWIFLNVSYEDEDWQNAKVIEPTLRIWKHNDSWNEPNGWTTESGVNTDDKYVYANITEFSEFGIFGESSEINECMGLIYPDTTYVLTDNLTGAQPSGTCITILADNIVLDCDGHTLSDDWNNVAIEISQVENVTVKNCVIKDYSLAIYDNTNNNTLIQNNTIITHSPSLNTDKVYGVYSDYSYNTTFIENTFHTMNSLDDAITADYFVEMNIINNTFGRFGCAVCSYDYFVENEKMDILNNTFDAYVSISLITRNLNISNNEFGLNPGSKEDLMLPIEDKVAHHIQLYESGNVYISDNVFENANVSVYVENYGDISIQNNVINSSLTGIHLNKITGLYLHDNLITGDSTTSRGLIIEDSSFDYTTFGYNIEDVGSGFTSSNRTYILSAGSSVVSPGIFYSAEVVGEEFCAEISQIKFKVFRSVGSDLHFVGETENLIYDGGQTYYEFENTILVQEGDVLGFYILGECRISISSSKGAFGSRSIPGDVNYDLITSEHALPIYERSTPNVMGFVESPGRVSNITLFENEIGAHIHLVNNLEIVGWNISNNQKGAYGTGVSNFRIQDVYFGNNVYGIELEETDAIKCVGTPNSCSGRSQFECVEGCYWDCTISGGFPPTITCKCINSPEPFSCSETNLDYCTTVGCVEQEYTVKNTNITFENLTIEGSDYSIMLGSTYSDFENGVSKNELIDSTILGGINSITLRNDSFLTSIGTTFDKNSVLVEDTSQLFVQWRTNVTVMDDRRTPVANSNVIFLDRFNTRQSFITNNLGKTSQSITELIQLSQDANTSSGRLETSEDYTTQDRTTLDFNMDVSGEITKVEVSHGAHEEEAFVVVKVFRRLNDSYYQFREEETFYLSSEEGISEFETSLWVTKQDAIAVYVSPDANVVDDTTTGAVHYVGGEIIGDFDIDWIINPFGIPSVRFSIELEPGVNSFTPHRISATASGYHPSSQISETINENKNIFLTLDRIVSPGVTTYRRTGLSCVGDRAEYFFHSLQAEEPLKTSAEFCNDLRLDKITLIETHINPEIFIEETTSTSEIPGIFYKQFATESTIPDEKIDELIFVLRVDKEWITENNIAPSTVRIYGLIEGVSRTTSTLLYNDEYYYYYSFESSAFKMFSVSGTEGVDFWIVLDLIQKYYMGDASFFEVIETIDIFYES